MPQFPHMVSDRVDESTETTLRRHGARSSAARRRVTLS